MVDQKYSFHLVWSDEDEAYIARCPEFPTLLAHGDTPDEALTEVQVALGGFIEIYLEEGLELPLPARLNLQYLTH